MRVALTFDAEHPEGRSTDPLGNAAAIIGTLSEESALASFFLQGKWAAAVPELARAIAAAGHLVGSHSHSHCPFPRLTALGVAADLGDARDALMPLVGETRPWLRLPQCAGQEDPRVLNAIHACGYRHVGRTVAHGDWWPDRDPDELASAIIADVLEQSATDTPVVLLHSWPDAAAAALPVIIRELRGCGAEFVTVDQLDVHA